MPMLPRVFQIHCEGPGQLAILSRPSAEWLAEDISGWRQIGIDIVVSLLTVSEEAELGLQAEAALCLSYGIEFLSFPAPDRGIPASPTDTLRLAMKLGASIRKGSFVGVHCRAGIGRSALLAACVLRALGSSTDTAFNAIRSARGVDVPDTPEQRAWVTRLTLAET